MTKNLSDKEKRYAGYDNNTLISQLQFLVKEICRRNPYTRYLAD